MCQALWYAREVINSTVVREDIREQLRLDLYAKRISVTALAKDLGLSRVTLSRMLNGQHEGKFTTWEAIAAKVGKRFALTGLEQGND